jgi:simple sugar transport system ATP-binding protein
VTADSEGTTGAAGADVTGAGVPGTASGPAVGGAPAPAGLSTGLGGDVLRAEHVGKRFGAVTALRDINLRLAPGEVLGLLGDNGAGKSTLLKILCGFQQPDTGRIVVDGQEVTLRSVDHARSLGIDVVYQDLALVNQLSVYHNMFLNREQVRWPLLSNRSMRKLTRQWLDEMGINIPSVDADVAMLSGGQRQAIAVARAVHSNAKILLLDEPLAAMGAKEGAIILDLVRDLKAKGDVSVIIIAHNYAQVLEICDRINLIQHGEVTFDKPAAETSLAELNDIVITEYRRALEERQREMSGSGSGGQA